MLGRDRSHRDRRSRARVARWLRRAPAPALPAHAVIVSPRKSTVIARDGAVRSVQSAELTMDGPSSSGCGRRPNLENLARTYWRFLSRVTLGLIRVVYERRQPLGGAARQAADAAALRRARVHDRGRPRRPSAGGSATGCSSPAPGGAAAFCRSTCGARTTDDTGRRAGSAIEVEVANFYPSIAAGFSMPVYEMTQSAIHVLVTHAFLRSLAKLDLATSKVGQLAAARTAVAAELVDADAQRAHLGAVVAGGDPRARCPSASASPATRCWRPASPW